MESPENASIQDKLALTLQDQGNLLKRLGDYKSAIERFEESLRVAEGLRKRQPDSWAYRRTEGLGHSNLAAVLAQTVRVPDAVREAEIGVRLLREVQASPQATPLDSSLLMLTWLTQIEALRKVDRLQDSEQVAKEAAAFVERERKSDSNLDYLTTFLHHEWSRTLQAMMDRDQDAIAVTDRGLEQARKLVESYPDSARIQSYRLVVARLGAQQAALNNRMGEPKLAGDRIPEMVKLIDELASLETPPTSVREAHAEILWIAAKIAKANSDLDAYRRFRSRAIEIDKEILEKVPLHEDVRKQLQEMQNDSAT